MDMPDYEAVFRDYAAAYERSLGERVDTAAIRRFYAEGFVAAGVNGETIAGFNDDGFERTLLKGYAFYKAIGTRSMKVDRVEAAPLFENHDSVRVFYRGGYQRADGEAVTIPFDVVYLLQRRADGPRIFAFIAGDELGLYREHGLVDDRGEPVRTTGRTP